MLRDRRVGGDRGPVGAYTVTMRVYVPALLSDLSVPLPPVHDGVIAVPDAAMSSEDVEVLEDDAITEAALASLVLARETDGALPTRVVLAVDTHTSTTLRSGEQLEPHIFEAPAFEYTWSDVAAILADLPDATPDVTAVLEAETQEEADDAVAALWESSLAWFDRSERPTVLALHKE